MKDSQIALKVTQEILGKVLCIQPFCFVLFQETLDRFLVIIIKQRLFQLFLFFKHILSIINMLTITIIVH